MGFWDFLNIFDRAFPFLDIAGDWLSKPVDYFEEHYILLIILFVVGLFVVGGLVYWANWQFSSKVEVVIDGGSNESYNESVSLSACYHAAGQQYQRAEVYKLV